jgi:hypothetical protein
VLLVGRSEAFDVAARVLDGRPSGSGAHDTRIAATESLDKADFRGHNKYMTTTAATKPRQTLDALLDAYYATTDQAVRDEIMAELDRRQNNTGLVIR